MSLFDPRGKTVVQLGRYGDILNILPLAYEAMLADRRLSIMVANEFSGLLDGCSYVDEIVFTGDYSRVDKAAQSAAQYGRPVVIPQVYGRGIDHRRISESFIRDQWEKVGKGHRWEQNQLVIDRRDFAREAELAAKFDWSRPVVLVNVAGRSSPYKEGDELVRQLVQKLPEFNVVDISALRAHRFFDLLGLYDRAAALVTIDTGTLHLAQASSIPVIALTSALPWYNSLRRPNHLLTRTYLEVDPDEIVESIRKTMRPCWSMVHLYPEWGMSEEDRRRVDIAVSSWKDEALRGPWRSVPVDYLTLPRNSQTAIGDSKPVPFVLDMLERGLAETRHDSDIIALSNSDIGITPGSTRRIRELVGAKGSAFSYRYNFDRIDAPLSAEQVTTGKWCGGLDTFFFTRKWVRENFFKLPDMVLGRCSWDIVYRDIVKATGGGDLHGAIWHERHNSYWVQNRETAGNLHNTAIFNDYMKKHDTTRPFR